MIIYFYRYDSLLVEKEELENAYEELQQEIEEGRVGDGDKQIRALKRVINNLEVSFYVLWSDPYDCFQQRQQCM